MVALGIPLKRFALSPHYRERGIRMSRKRTIAAAIVGAAVWIVAACKSTNVTTYGHDPRERLQPGPAVLVEHPVTPNKEADEREGNILETLRDNYILPRAYPALEIDPQKRRRAYEELIALRAAKGMPHVFTEWRSPQGPGGGPGPGGGGPGAPGTMDPSGCAWVATGPTNINGRVTSIAVDPNNRDRIFVASVGGIWRSTDRGRRWQRVSDDFLATIFASVAVNPAMSSEVFAGGGDPNYGGANAANGLGIWRSTSNGDFGTWTKVSPPELDDQVISRIIIDPASPNHVYAATSIGVYRGSRMGSTITFSRLGTLDSWVNDIAVDLSSTPRKVYAGVRNDGSYERGIWRWSGGMSWSRRDSGIDMTTTRTINLALAPSAPGTIYAKIEHFVPDDPTSGQLQGIYKTTTGGEPPAPGANAWSNLPGASVVNDSGWPGFWYSWYNSVIEVDPSNANIVYAGGFNLFRTNNGGGLWEPVSSGADPSYSFSIHADQHAVAFDPVNPKIVYSGNDGGIDRSTDTSLGTWHWEDISHGMLMTEFYRMTTQRATANLVAGGSQDNGTEITFGNRTWYNPGGCDGAHVASDGTNSDTLYAYCNGNLYELSNPVPGTPGGGSHITWVSPVTPAAPVVTDPTMPGRALTSSATGCNPLQILETVDGINWSSILTLPAGARVTSIAVAPGSSFQKYLVGVIYLPPSTDDCPGFSGAYFPPTVWRTTNGGGMWASSTSGVPNGWLTSFAFDPGNTDRVYMTANYDLVTSPDFGANFSPITGTLPVGAYLADVEVNPASANTLYLATSIGVLKGTATTLGGATTATWVPFDEGLPDGLNVTDMTISPVTGVLTISSMGHATYQRDVRTGITCPQRALLVRDNVFDRGVTPAPAGIPDPEHPVPDPARPPFYKPDDSPAGRVYWWSSTDIRIDVPSLAPPANQLSAVDHVEFETCPIDLPVCPAGTLLDQQPRRGLAARAYVQVANRGIASITNVRVISLWTDSTTSVPLLPVDFWTTTFPASGPCGALDPSSPWKFVDTAMPCKNIPLINPDVPEVVRFDWNVPSSAPAHACYLTIVESPDDPINPAVRAMNQRAVWDIVPNNRQISQRNLHPIDPPPAPMGGGAPHMMETVEVPNPTDQNGIELTFATNAIAGEGVRVFLPTAAGVELVGVKRTQDQPAQDELVFARENKLDPSATFVVATGSSMKLPIAPGERWRIALVAASAGGPARLSVVASQNGKVLGGSTYMLRVAPKE